MNLPITPIPLESRRKWDNQNRLGLLITFAVCILLWSINQYFRANQAAELRQRAMNIGLVIPDKWQSGWEDQTTTDPYLVDLQNYARQQNAQIMVGKLDFPYLAVELISWENRLERLELGRSLKQRGEKLGFTTFPNLHLPTDPQQDPINSLQVWQEIIEESEKNYGKLLDIKKQGQELSIHTEYWLPPFSDERIKKWERGIQQTKYYASSLDSYYAKAKLLAKDLPKFNPPYDKKIREEIHLLVRIWEQQSSLRNWALENQMEIQDLRDTLQNCKRNTQHCDPRWGEQAFFSYSPEDKDHWQSLGIINPHADEHYFTLHLLDTEETVYWFLLMLYYQQIGLVQNAPTQIEYFSWNNQDQIKQLQLQQDIQSNNGPSKEYQHH